MTAYTALFPNGNREDVTAAMLEIYLPCARETYRDADAEVIEMCARSALGEDLGAEILASAPAESPAVAGIRRSFNQAWNFGAIAHRAGFIGEARKALIDCAGFTADEADAAILDWQA